MLNRSSFKPLYFQLGEALRALIDEKLNPGDQIPSENDLIAQYNVSRNTIRMALDLLEKQGLLYRVKGKGTFVAPERMRYGLLHLTSFSEEMVRRGFKPSSRVINFEQVKPNHRVVEQLCLTPDQPVFRIERLRLADDRPMSINISYVPCDIFPNLQQIDLATHSLYQALESAYPFRIAYAEQVLKPTIASDYEAQLLEIQPGDALMLVDGVAFFEDGRPAEYGKLMYRGDRYDFTIHAVRQPHNWE